MSLIKQIVDTSVRQEMTDFIEFYMVQDTSVGVSASLPNARGAQGTWNRCRD